MAWISLRRPVRRASLRQTASGDAVCGSPVLVVILTTEAGAQAVAARPRARRER
jgi:hypothetical protein